MSRIKKSRGLSINQSIIIYYFCLLRDKDTKSLYMHFSTFFLETFCFQRIRSFVLSEFTNFSNSFYISVANTFLQFQIHSLFQYRIHHFHDNMH